MCVTEGKEGMGRREEKSGKQRKDCRWMEVNGITQMLSIKSIKRKEKMAFHKMQQILKGISIMQVLSLLRDHDDHEDEEEGATGSLKTR